MSSKYGLSSSGHTNTKLREEREVLADGSSKLRLYPEEELFDKIEMYY